MLLRKIIGLALFWSGLGTFLLSLTPFLSLSDRSKAYAAAAMIIGFAVYCASVFPKSEQKVDKAIGIESDIGGDGGGGD